MRRVLKGRDGKKASTEAVQRTATEKIFALRRRVLTVEFSVIGAVFVALALTPVLIPGQPYVQHIAITAMIFALLAAGWDTAMGYTGQLAVAHVSFFATGAYSWAVLDLAGFGPVPAVGLAILFSLILGFLVGVLCLRFRGPFILVVSLALIEVQRVVVLLFRETTGGSRGLSGFGRFPGADSLTGNYYVALIILFVVTIGLGVTGRSMLGKRFRAIRENQSKAEMIGIDTIRLKIIAFVVSAGVAGLAGAFHAQYVRVLEPGIFSQVYLVYPIAMAIIGGIGTIFGPVIGSILFVILAEFLSTTGAYIENALLGVLLIVVMIFRPDGIWNLGVDSLESRFRGRMFSTPPTTTEPEESR